MRIQNKYILYTSKKIKKQSHRRVTCRPRRLGSGVEDFWDPEFPVYVSQVVGRGDGIALSKKADKFGVSGAVVALELLAVVDALEIVDALV